MRALLVSTVATGVLLLGLMGAHTATPPPGASSTTATDEIDTLLQRNLLYPALISVK